MKSSVFIKPTIPEVINLFISYRCNNGTWYSLSEVMINKCISKESVKRCLYKADELDDEEGFVLAKVLFLMSKTQRRKIPYIVEQLL